MTSMKSQGESPAFTRSAIWRALDRRLATATLRVRSPIVTPGFLDAAHAAHVLEVQLREVLAGEQVSRRCAGRTP